MMTQLETLMMIPALNGMILNLKLAETMTVKHSSLMISAALVVEVKLIKTVSESIRNIQAKQ